MLGTATTFAQSASAPKPPVAEKIRTERPINGAVLVDDYAWLRERSNPQVRQYLELENAYAEQVTASEKPFAEKLYSETLSHIKQSDTSVPYRKRGYWYYLRTEEGKQYPVLCRKKETLSSPEEVMLDYDNVTATAYPAILVQTSFDDSQVMYWEPSKYVAKLRALKTDSNPLVFFINMHGGHGGSSGRYDRMREQDRRYAFMLIQLGITQ